MRGDPEVHRDCERVVARDRAALDRALHTVGECLQRRQRVLEVFVAALELGDRALEHHAVEVRTRLRRRSVGIAEATEVEHGVVGARHRAHVLGEPREPFAVERAQQPLLAAELRVDALRRRAHEVGEPPGRQRVRALLVQHRAGGVEQREAQLVPRQLALAHRHRAAPRTRSRAYNDVIATRRVEAES